MTKRYTHMGRQAGLWAVALACLPGVVLASDPLIPREACTPVYSVQKRNCQVEHLFRCKTGDGVIFRGERWAQDEPLKVDERNVQGDTLREWVSGDGMSFDGFLKVFDPFDVPAAIASGQDSFHTVVSLRTKRFVEMLPVSFQGQVTHRGEILRLDGIRFHLFEIQGQIRTRPFAFQVKIDGYYDMDTGASIWGAGSIIEPGKEDQIGGEPIAVIRPDEPGFGENFGLYDCGRAN